jgi:hypothetical protein
MQFRISDDRSLVGRLEGEIQKGRVGKKRHKHFQWKQSAEDHHKPSLEFALPGEAPSRVPSYRAGRRCEKSWVWQRSGDQRQNQPWEKYTAAQGDQATKGVTHQNGRSLNDLL